MLLILTDGSIHDMPLTKQRLVDLSQLPCSVIIIGLGDDDFDNMEILDGDGPNRLTDDDGRVAERDIVQFVEFTKCVEKGNLAEQVLEEIPDQFIGYMKARSIQIAYQPQDLSKFPPREAN